MINKGEKWEDIRGEAEDVKKKRQQEYTNNCTKKISMKQVTMMVWLLT